MELKLYMALVRRWLWLIVLCTLLAAGGGFVASQLTVPAYEASTTLLINQAPVSSTSPDYNSVLTSERLARTYAELLRKRPVLEEVVANLGLDTDPDLLAQRVGVNAVRDTQLIVLTVEDIDPQRAADIANEIVAVFIQQNRELQSSRYSASIQSLELELAKLQEDIDNTQSRLDELQSATVPEELAERDRLQALLAQYRSSYATLLESYENVRLAEAQSTDSVSVAEEAQPKRLPVRPKTTLNIFLGGMVGGLFAIGIALLLEQLDDTLKSTEEIEQLAGASTLGVIARIEGDNPAEKLVTAKRPRSQVAEAYRVLRANIEFSLIDNGIKTVVVTSAGPIEGKSTSVANLAVAMAQAGKRIILVDTDLRRPTLHQLFEQSNARGITTALIKQEGRSISDYLVPTGVRNLRLLPSGPLPPNPAELLGSQRMAELIENLRMRAELVLFDSPPLLAVADTTILASVCDATLLVVLAASTKADSLRKATEQLAQSGTRLLGVILNRVSTSSSSYYYHYHYHYYASSDSEQRKRHRLHSQSSSQGEQQRHTSLGFLSWIGQNINNQVEIAFEDGSVKVKLVENASPDNHR